MSSMSICCILATHLHVSFPPTQVGHSHMLLFLQNNQLSFPSAGFPQIQSPVGGPGESIAVRYLLLLLLLLLLCGIPKTFHLAASSSPLPLRQQMVEILKPAVALAGQAVPRFSITFSISACMIFAASFPASSTSA